MIVHEDLVHVSDDIKESIVQLCILVIYLLYKYHFIVLFLLASMRYFTQRLSIDT